MSGYGCVVRARARLAWPGKAAADVPARWRIAGNRDPAGVRGRRSADPDRFFLLIEEEGIDEMSHHGNAHLTVTAGRALDETVGLALDFAAKTPGTLVLVVGDHETGGLAIENVDPADKQDENPPGEQAEDEIPIANADLVMSVDWTTNNHTGAATPITASGPGSADLGRVLRNTEVHDAVRAAMVRCDR